LIWIHRIAINTAIDPMRQPSFRRAAQVPSLDRPETIKGEIEDEDVWTGESAPSLEQIIHYREGLDCLCGVIETLPENYCRWTISPGSSKRAWRNARCFSGP